MRELSTDEMEQVSGGYMTLDGGLNMIGALAGAAVFLGAPAAAAFGAGVFLGGMMVEAFS